MPFRTRPQPAPILFLALFAAQAGFLVLTPILPDVAGDLGVSIATAGALRIASGLAGTGVALTLGLTAPRLGLRDLVAAGLLLVALGSCAGASAPTFLVLALSQLALGAGQAMVLSGALAAAASWSAPAARSRVLGLVLLGQPAAWIAGMPAIGALASSSWRLAMCAPVAASAIALAALAGRPPDAPAPRGRMRQLLRRDSAVVGWAMGELLAYAAWGGTITFAAALMIQSYGASPALVGLLIAAGAAAYFPGNLLARRRTDDCARELLALLGGSLTVPLALFGAIRPGLWFSASMFGVIVLLVGGRTLSGSAAGFQAAPGHELAVMSIRAAAMQLGIVIGSALGGAALAAGGYPLLGAVLSILFAAGAVPHLAALRTRAIPDHTGSRPRPKEVTNDAGDSHDQQRGGYGEDVRHAGPDQGAAGAGEVPVPRQQPLDRWGAQPLHDQGLLRRGRRGHQPQRGVRDRRG
jgi:predicted MFS family arabinose efflux permease